MNLSLLRFGLVCGVLFVFVFAISRGDFQWNQQQGPPQQLTDSICGQSPKCTADACTDVNPAVEVVPDGETKAILVKSYYPRDTVKYGTCTGGTITCDKYPNVKCGSVYIYGLPKCADEPAIKTVYSGNCTP